MYVYWQEYFQGQFQRQQVKSSYDLIAKSKTDRYFFIVKSCMSLIYGYNLYFFVIYM